jgi:hypothetical protein
MTFLKFQTLKWHYRNIPSIPWNHQNTLLISWDYPFKFLKPFSCFAGFFKTISHRALRQQNFWQDSISRKRILRRYMKTTIFQRTAQVRPCTVLIVQHTAKNHMIHRLVRCSPHYKKMFPGCTCWSLRQTFIQSRPNCKELGLAEAAERFLLVPPFNHMLFWVYKSMSSS